ncbi:MerR family transcriptional regulator [Arsenicicoccus dermatophilus]|uniref:MerR family transcriptional regulator n=1 Tax=Arsenicicoccus dermatophilus TaxID=1076331 RepID=UPI003916DF5F
MAETTTLMTIGEFSRLSRLSVRMLRHYDAHGVLVPAAVDPSTGYRRYAPAQLATAAEIRALRDVGFAVSTISALLAARGTDAWTNALELQRATLADELRACQHRVTLINRMLTHGEPTMTITVERRTIPAMTVVALRGTVPTYADEPRLWQQMTPLLTAQGITPTGPCGVIEHDDEYTEHDVDLQIFVPVDPATTATAPLEVITLPERDCLVARVAGPYEQISTAHDEINARITTDGLRPAHGITAATKTFNCYLTTPDQVGPGDLVTEVCQPLA